MKASEIKRVALTGKLTQFSQGDTVIRQGEDGLDVFLILAGGAEVTARPGANDEPTTLDRLGRGDLFGEMAYVSKTPRSATVTATEHLEVLRIDDIALERIHQRYPRIAAKIFFNFSAILSDRLQKSSRPSSRGVADNA